MIQYAFNHLALSVKDVDRSMDFYQKLFKFKEIENTASKSKTRWLSIGEGKQLHLISRPNAEIKINKAVHFAFTTPHYDDFVALLVSSNIPYSDWPNSPNKDYVRDDGVRQVYFQDPDGYWIEVNDDIL